MGNQYRDNAKCAVALSEGQRNVESGRQHVRGYMEGNGLLSAAKGKDWNQQTSCKAGGVE